MNANTALKINDAIDQAVRCGESLEETRAQVERALARAVEEHRPQSGLSSSAFAYALAAQVSLREAWGDGSAPDTFSQVKVLHRGCANEAAWWTFETSLGEVYAVEVQRRSQADERILEAVAEIEATA